MDPKPHGHEDLETVRRTFEAFGRDDPLYAALTRAETRGNRWDPEAFFQTGRAQIAKVMAYVAGLGLDPPRGRALDFGCGAGRLTQGLAEHFEEAVGVDIAESMIETARSFNQHGERVRYEVNTAPDLRRFPDASFDFIYTNKVLQHIPPEYQERYVAEFVRLLTPRGLAVFQLRNGPRIRPGSLRAWLYTLNRRHFRRLAQRLRGRAPYEMHYLARERVEEIVAAAGGRVLDVVDLSSRRPGKSLRFCVARRSAPDLAGAAAPRA